MKEAILQGKDFEFDNRTFNKNEDGEYSSFETIATNMSMFRTLKPTYLLENQDKLVEVKDNYWDSEGRAIRELEEGMKFYVPMNESDSLEQIWGNKYHSYKIFFNTGNCFKDKESAEAELTRLKQKQKERMAQNDK